MLIISNNLSGGGSRGRIPLAPFFFVTFFFSKEESKIFDKEKRKALGTSAEKFWQHNSRHLEQVLINKNYEKAVGTTADELITTVKKQLEQLLMETSNCKKATGTVADA